MMLNIVHAYGLMAYLCYHIRLLDSETQCEIYRTYWKNPEHAKQTIESAFAFLNRRNTDEVLLFDSFTIDELQVLLEKINYWNKTNSDRIMLLYLLVYLDQQISFKKSIDHFCETLEHKIPNVYTFHCLNNNERAYSGRLMPRLEPLWAKGSNRPRSALTEDPLSIMHNYFWVEKIDGWEINNVYSPKWRCETGKHYTIVCSPLTNQQTFEYLTVKDSNCNYFNITTYHEAHMMLIKERFEKILAHANMREANILLFPEILASKECQRDCRGITKRHWEYAHPKILCLPSSEFVEDGVWKNQMLVLNDSGEEIFSYNKQQAFQLDEKEKPNEGEESAKSVRLFEPIIPDHKITIMHVEGVGRIGVIICADIFNSELCNILLNKYEIRLLLIMAYTAGYDQFFREIAMAQTTSCDVVWCNACANYTSAGNTGPAVAYFAYGHRDRDVHTIPHCKPKDKTPCNGCFVTITIDPLYGQSGTMTWNHLT